MRARSGLHTGGAREPGLWRGVLWSTALAAAALAGAGASAQRQASVEWQIVRIGACELRHAGSEAQAVATADELEAIETELRSALQAEAAPHEATLLVLHPSTESYLRESGQRWWTSGVTRGSRIDLQPRALLERKGIWHETLRHELAHRWLQRLSNGRAPAWFQEGWAVRFGGIASVLGGAGALTELGAEPFDALESALAGAASRGQAQAARLAAYLVVRELERHNPALASSYCAALAAGSGSAEALAQAAGLAPATLAQVAQAAVRR
jgi:hypothetical protein